MNVRNHEGSTALIIATENDHYEVVKLLMENDADVNIKEESSLTALIIGKSYFTSKFHF